MGANRISFIMRAIYDVLPSLTILQLWFGEDPVCHLCASPATLQQILVGCKASLIQGRYTWHHNKVLRCLAATPKDKGTSTKATPLNTQPQIIPFMQEEEKQQTKPSICYAGLPSKGLKKVC